MPAITPQKAVQLMESVKCINTANIALARLWTEQEVLRGRTLAVEDIGEKRLSKLAAAYTKVGWVVTATKLGYLRFGLPLLRSKAA